MNAPVPGPVSLPQPQAKPIVPKRTLARLAAGAAPPPPPVPMDGGIAVPPPSIRSFAEGGEITGEDTSALWAQQEEDERKRQEAYQAGPLPPPAGPPTYTPSPAGAVVGGLIAKDPLSQPPSIRELAPPPAPDPIKEAANTWTPSQVVNMVAKAQELGLFDNVKAALPALAQEYTAKANAGDVPVPSGDPRIAGAQQSADNLARVQGILGPGLGGPLTNAVSSVGSTINNLASAVTPNYIERANENRSGPIPDTTLPYGVTPWLERNVQAPAGDVGAFIAGGPNALSGGRVGMENPGAQDIGRGVAEALAPTKGVDFSLNAGLASGGPWKAPIEALTGIGGLDDIARGGLRAITGGLSRNAPETVARAVATDVPIPSSRFNPLTGAENAYGTGSRGGTGNLPIPPATQPDDVMDAMRRSIEARGGTVPTPPPAAALPDPDALRQQITNAAPADTVTLYHTVDRETADAIRQQGFNPGSALTSDEETARLLGGNRHGDDAVVLRFEVPRSSVDPESWYFTNNQRIFPSETPAPPLAGGGTPPAPTAAEAGLAPPASPPPASPELSPMMQQVERARAEAAAAQAQPGYTPGYTGPPPSYPAGPPGTMAEQFPEISGTRQYNTQGQLVTVNPNSPASRMGAPEAYNPANFPPTPQASAADTAMRGAGAGPVGSQTVAGNTVPTPPATSYTIASGSNTTQQANALKTAAGTLPAPSPNIFGMGLPPRAVAATGPTPQQVLAGTKQAAANAGVPAGPAQDYMKAWLDVGTRRLNGLPNPKGDYARQFAMYQNTILGRSGDPFVAELVDKRIPALEAGLSRREGGHLRGTALDNAVKQGVTDQIKLSFPNDLAKQADIQNQIDAVYKEQARIEKNWESLITLKERTQNTMFGLLDEGVFMVQGLAGLQNGVVPFIMGNINEGARMLHMPHFSLMHAGANQERLLWQVNHGANFAANNQGVTQGAGTLGRYIPGVSSIDKNVITPLLDAKTNMEFGGIMGFIHDRINMGNLMMAKLTGSNLSDPKAMNEIMKVGNDIISKGATPSATAPARSVVDRLTLLSSGMTHAMTNRIVDMGQLINPLASKEQRVLAASMIVSNAVFIGVIGKALHDQFGAEGSKFEMNPFQPGFGNIQTPFKDKDGNNLTFSLISQGALNRALARSIPELMDMDTNALADTWSRFLASRESPQLAAVFRAAGYGYDSNGKFYSPSTNGGAKMPTSERIKASIPAPPFAMQLYNGNKTSAPELVAGFAGSNTFGTIPGIEGLSERKDERNDAAKNLYNEDYNKLGSREKEKVNAEVGPDKLKEYRDEAVKAGNKVEIAQREKEDIKASFQPHFAALEAKLKDGSMTPFQVRELTSALEKQMYDSMNKVKFPEFGGDQKPSPIQKAEAEYRSLYDKAPKGADGKTDYATVHRLQTAYIAQQAKAQGPEFGQRLADNVLPRVNPNDSAMQQFYDSPQMKAAVSGYNARNNDPDENATIAHKTAFKLEDPARDALLYAGGYTRTLASPAAAEAYKTYSEGKPDVNFNVGFRQEGYQTYRQMESGPMGKEVKEYQTIPSLDRDDYLRAHPDLNAALWQHGHTSHIYSLDAYDKVTGKTSTGATATVQALPPATAAAAPQGSVVPVPSPAPSPQQPVAALGPDGRTVAQIAGTPYKSDAERNFYFESRGLQVPTPGQTANPVGAMAPSGGSGSAYQTNAQGRTPPVNAADMAPIAQRYGIQPGPLALLMNHEGNGAHDTSEKGVQPARWGIVQTTARANGINDTTKMTPEQAYNIAGKYIATGLEQNKGDEAKAYGSYFVGQGNIQKAVAMGGDWVKNADRLAEEEGRKAGVNYGSHSMTDFMQYLGFR